MLRVWKVLIAFGVVYAAVAASTGALLVVDRNAELVAGERRASLLADIAAEHVRQVVFAIDLGFAALDDDLRAAVRQGAHFDEALADRFRVVTRLAPALLGIGYVDIEGAFRVGASGTATAGIDLSDRDYFQELRDARADAPLWIGVPIVSRPDGSLSVPIARRVSAPDGAFLGVIAARLDPRYFNRFFGALGADAVALVKVDGRFVARFPDGDLSGAAPLAIVPLDARGRGIARDFVSPVDGVARIAAFRRIDALPFVVEGGMDLDAWLANWRWRRDAALAALGVLALIAVVGAWTLDIRQRAQAVRMRADADRRIAETARDLAQHADRKKTEFLAHMSHELRTPLNAIIGFSQMMEGEILGPHRQTRYREYSADIRFSAEHLLAVVNNILDLARVEAGKWIVEENDHAAADLVADVMRLAKDRAARENVRVELRDEAPGAVLRCDARAIVQVLLNLVINAIKFAGEDRLVRVDVARTRAGGLAFAVADRGPGMSDEDAARALRPFETAAQSGSRKQQDTGLGLPLARAFAEMHEGSLRLTTAPGQGTVVTVELPAARVIFRAAG